MMQRSLEKEYIDLGSYSKDEYEECLFLLDRVGRWLGGNRANFKALTVEEPQSILDVGSGGGLFAIAMARRFPQAKIVGLEVNPLAIAFAKRQLLSIPNPPYNVTFELRDPPVLTESSQSFDVVMATLVCHHFDDESLIDFLKKARRIAKKKVIINDLHRHWMAYYGFKALSPFFFRNRLVMHDGPLSVARAFKRADWVCFLASAGIPKERYTIEWHWAFRWLVTIDGGE